jgi:hypothetical protein
MRDHAYTRALLTQPFDQALEEQKRVRHLLVASGNAIQPILYI